MSEDYEKAVIELFSSGLASEVQWEEMAAVVKLASDDYVLRDLITTIDAVVRKEEAGKPSSQGGGDAQRPSFGWSFSMSPSGLFSRPRTLRDISSSR